MNGNQPARGTESAPPGGSRLHVPALRPDPGEGVLLPQPMLDLWQAESGTEVPMYLADAAGNLLHANAAYHRLAPFIGAAAAPPIEDIAASIEALGRPLRQDLVVQVEGAYECYVVERMVVRDSEGRPFGVMGRFIPAGELRRVGLALTLAENRLDDFARLISDWVWEIDRELAITFASPRVFEQLGYHPCELIGRRMPDLIEAGREFRDVVRRRGPAAFRDLPVDMRHRDGTRRMLRLSAVPIFAEDGTFEGYRGTAQDVTEREAQYAALVKAVDDAEAANRAKTEFLANMSHELRTPLNAIMGFSEIMKLELLGPMGHEKYREYTDDILASSRHLLNLINDILDIAKIEAGRLDLEEGDVAPAELLWSVQRVVAEAAERGGLRLTVVHNPDLPRILVDERRLRQVLLNLLSNAVKFTPPGGEVRVETHRTEDGGLEFVVSDTGVGIAQEEIAIAMAPFSQLDSGLARKFEGTGLGLPLSKALTELHGGTFLLESTVGAGTTVHVRLPPGRVLND